MAVQPLQAAKPWSGAEHVEEHHTSFAASRAPFGSRIRGKTYMEPSAGLHVTPSSLFSASSIITARRLSDDRMPSRSSANCLYDGSPSCTRIWRATLHTMPATEG